MKSNKLLSIATGLFVFGILIYSVVSITYAIATHGTASARVLVGSKVSQAEDYILVKLEASNLYPGSEEHGIITIENNRENDIKINELGLKVDIKEKPGINSMNLIESSFLNRIHISIEKGALPIFTNKIVKDSPLKDLICTVDTGKINGYFLNNIDQFTIKSGEVAQLRYTLHMDEASGNELQGLKSVIELLIDFEDLE